MENIKCRKTLFIIFRSNQFNKLLFCGRSCCTCQFNFIRLQLTYTLYFAFINNFHFLLKRAVICSLLNNNLSSMDTCPLCTGIFLLSPTFPKHIGGSCFNVVRLSFCPSVRPHGNVLVRYVRSHGRVIVLFF